MQAVPPMPPVKIDGGNGGQRCILGNLNRSGKIHVCEGTLHANPEWVSWDVEELGLFVMDTSDFEGFGGGDFSEEERARIVLWTQNGYEWLRYGGVGG